MTYRMLLGREALAAFGALVDPAARDLRLGGAARGRGRLSAGSAGPFPGAGGLG
jgi:hypothetical protein